MSLMRRFVYLVTRADSHEKHSGQLVYSMRRIKMSRFFYKSEGKSPPPPSQKHGFVEATLPSPCMRFFSPMSKYYNSDMEFMPLGGDQILAVDRICRTSIYDGGASAVRNGPSFCKSPVDWNSICVPVADAGLYVLSRNGSFQALVRAQLPMKLPELSADELLEDWSCETLPLPPVPNIYPFSAYTVVGGNSIWISGKDVGTYAFDIARHTWAKQGDWELPFTDCAHYVPEHKLWFGLSMDDSNGNALCTVDLATGLQPPVLGKVMEQDVKPPKDWLSYFPYLLHLGSSKFCIARTFTKRVGEGDWCDDIEINFLVMTAVEVVRSANGRGLRMVKHKSACYSLGHTQILQVL